METEVISALVSTAANAERLGMLGLSFVIIGVLVVILVKVLKSIEKNTMSANTELLKTIKEIQVSNKIQAEVMKLQVQNSIDFGNWVKDNCVGVKIRLDSLEQKMNEIDKNIIALK